MKLWHISVVLILAACTALVIAVLERLDLEEDDQPKPRTGRASWYGEAYRGRTMANGHRYVPELLTCAAYEWPLGTWLEVTCGQRRVVVQVTDRGPAHRFGRILDLSKGAFDRLADSRKGVIEVSVRVVAPPGGAR